MLPLFITVVTARCGHVAEFLCSCVTMLSARHCVAPLASCVNGWQSPLIIEEPSSDLKHSHTFLSSHLRAVQPRSSGESYFLSQGTIRGRTTDVLGCTPPCWALSLFCFVWDDHLPNVPNNFISGEVVKVGLLPHSHAELFFFFFSQRRFLRLSEQNLKPLQPAQPNQHTSF